MVRENSVVNKKIKKSKLNQTKQLHDLCIKKMNEGEKRIVSEVEKKRNSKSEG